MLILSQMLYGCIHMIVDDLIYITSLHKFKVAKEIIPVE